ncbi:MAG: SurA N-terminal domain-containing protein [Synergistetes bacterium]|nr:SurA N-terminal domain-containing protein [Synergistota bacterium]MCX8127857.1 SurA N-terminal domain-containing protein [Synergistota bacterium]MDW8192119.1 SurA N-terminal domain-containing protein [Synergistota bacterium]
MFKTLRNQMKLIFIIVTIFFALSIYIGYDIYTRGKGSPTHSPSTTAAIVNGVPISTALLNAAIRNELSNYKAEDLKKLTKEDFENIRRNVLQALINYELVYQEAIKEGLKPSSKEIDDAISNIEKRFSTKEEFLNFLQRQGISLADLRKGLERELTVNKILRKIQENVVIDENQIRSIYEKHKDALVEPKKFEIAYKVFNEFQKAEEFYKQLKSGKKWEEIEPEIKPQARSLYELPKSFSENEGELKENSPFLIKGEETSWVGYVFSIIPPRQKSYEEVKKQLESILKYTEGLEAQRKFILSLREKADIKYPDPSLAPLPPSQDKKAESEEEKLTKESTPVKDSIEKSSTETKSEETERKTPKENQNKQ